MEIKKLLQKQATLKLPKKIDKNSEVKLSMASNQQSAILKRKFTRSISSFNNIQMLGDSLQKKNTASQRKFRRTHNTTLDPLKNMQNLFVQHPVFHSQQQVISDINTKFQLCLSVTKQYKQQKLQRFIQTLKEYIGEIFRNLVEIESNKMKKVISKVKLMSQQYQKRIENAENQALLKLKSQKLKNNCELSKKIQELAMRATFSNLLIRQLCNSRDVDMEQEINSTYFMHNYTKQAQKVREIEMQNEFIHTQSKQCIFKQIVSNLDSRPYNASYLSLNTIIPFQNMES